MQVTTLSPPCRLAAAAASSHQPALQPTNTHRGSNAHGEWRQQPGTKGRSRLRQQLSTRTPFGCSWYVNVQQAHSTAPSPPLLRTRAQPHTAPPPAQVVAYDGSDFAGFQFQPKVRTVQGELEKAAARVLLPAGRVVGGWSGPVRAPSIRPLWPDTHADRGICNLLASPCLTQAPAARTPARTPQAQLHTSTWSAAPTASSLTA